MIKKRIDMVVIYCSHTRELLISLVKFFTLPNVILVTRVYNNQIPYRCIKHLYELKQKYPKRIYIYEVRYSKSKLYKYIDYASNIFKDLYFISKFFLKIDNCQVFFESLYPCKLLKFICKIDLLEHGAINYQYKYDSNSIDTYGRKNFISSIELLNTKESPSDIKNKVIKLNLFEDFNSLDELSKDYIYNVFNFNKNIKNIDTLIITQPLSEDDFISENRKIEIYKKIYKFGYAIKPHPRETTKYENFFDCEIINSSIPIELVFMSGVSIKNLITLYSSIFYSPEEIDTNIIMLGVDFDEQLLSSLKIKDPNASELTNKFFMTKQANIESR